MRLVYPLVTCPMPSYRSAIVCLSVIELGVLEKYTMNRPSVEGRAPIAPLGTPWQCMLGHATQRAVVNVEQWTYRRRERCNDAIMAPRPHDHAATGQIGVGSASSLRLVWEGLLNKP